MIDRIIINDNRVYMEIAASMVNVGLYEASKYTKDNKRMEQMVRVAIDYLMHVNTSINPTLEKENAVNE